MPSVVSQILWLTVWAGHCGSFNECLAEEDGDCMFHCSMESMNLSWFTRRSIHHHEDFLDDQHNLSICFTITEVCSDNKPKFRVVLMRRGEVYQTKLSVRPVAPAPILRHVSLQCGQWDPELEQYKKTWSCSLTTSRLLQSSACVTRIVPNGSRVTKTCKTLLLCSGITRDVLPRSGPRVYRLERNNSPRTKADILETKYFAKSSDSRSHSHKSTTCPITIQLKQSGLDKVLIKMFLNPTQTRLLPAVAITALPLTNEMPVYSRDKRSVDFRNNEIANFIFRSKRSVNETATSTDSDDSKVKMHVLISVICVLLGILLVFVLIFAVKRLRRVGIGKSQKRPTRLDQGAAELLGSDTSASASASASSSSHTYAEAHEYGGNGAMPSTTIFTTWSTDSFGRSANSQVSTVISVHRNSAPHRQLAPDEYIAPCTPPRSVSASTINIFDDSTYTCGSTLWDDGESDTNSSYNNDTYADSTAYSYTFTPVNTYDPNGHSNQHTLDMRGSHCGDLPRAQHPEDETLTLNEDIGHYVNIDILRHQGIGQLHPQARTSRSASDPVAGPSTADTSHRHSSQPWRSTINHNRSANIPTPRHRDRPSQYQWNLSQYYHDHI